MTMPLIANEFGVVQEPELRFNSSGAPWLKIRGKAQDRAYNAETKEWEDKGDPLYIDIIVSGKMAENLYESVTIGDAIVVIGRLLHREWTNNDGEKRGVMQIRADSVGVSMRYTAAKSRKMTETGAKAPALSVVENVSDEAPF